MAESFDEGSLRAEILALEDPIHAAHELVELLAISADYAGRADGLDPMQCRGLARSLRTVAEHVDVIRAAWDAQTSA
jgi:hypothetical protein